MEELVNVPLLGLQDIFGIAAMYGVVGDVEEEWLEEVYSIKMFQESSLHRTLLSGPVAWWLLITSLALSVKMSVAYWPLADHRISSFCQKS